MSYVGTLVKVLFLISQFLLALHFTLESFDSWNSSPVVTSVSTKPIEEVPFPAVTICPPNNGKWMALAKVIENLSTTKQVFDFITIAGDKKFQFIVAKAFLTYTKLLNKDQDKHSMSFGRLTLKKTHIFNWAIRDGNYKTTSLNDNELEMALLLHYSMFLRNDKLDFLSEKVIDVLDVASLDNESNPTLTATNKVKGMYMSCMLFWKCTCFLHKGCDSNLYSLKWLFQADIRA
jgi:hypothetical protein